MVSQLQQVAIQYIERLQLKSYVPRFSYGRGLTGDDGGPNRLFFVYLFGDDALAICFLQDAPSPRTTSSCTKVRPHSITLRNPTDNSRARSAHSRLRAKLAIVIGASFTIPTTRTSVRKVWSYLWQ